MSVLSLLSTSQGLTNNEANIALAKEIASTKNNDAVKELVDNLNNKNKKLQGDCIKVLYETGYIAPELIAAYYQEFIALLTCKNNRMVWGAMIALSCIVTVKPDKVFKFLDLIIDTVEKGSVITKDCGVDILAKLGTISTYNSTTEPLLHEQLLNCPIKQLPQYAEKSLVSINGENKDVFCQIIESRMPECEKDSQKKRLAKVLKQIHVI